MLARLTTLTVVFAVFTATMADAQDRARAFVLDQAARSVTVLDLPSGNTSATAALEGTPTILLRTPDGKRLLVLDRGQGRQNGTTFEPTTKSAVTILDAPTLAIQARVELGWGLDPAAMLGAAGDRLAVLCPGLEARKNVEPLPRELVTVDLTAGKVLSRVALPRPATAAFALPDATVAIVLSSYDQQKKAAPTPAELRFVDLTAGTIAATIPLEGDPGTPLLSPDAAFVYLLDRGNPSGNPQKNVNGKLQIVSVANRAVHAVTDAGSNPRGFVVDERGGQVFLWSDGPPVKGKNEDQRPGELRVLRGDRVGAPIAVSPAPQRLEANADGTALHVIGRWHVSRVALPALTADPPIRVPGIGHPEMEGLVSAEINRAFVLYGNQLSTHDLTTGAELKGIRTGRTGKQLWLGLQTAGRTELGRISAERQAIKEGKSYYSYTEYTLKPVRGSLALQPDGKALYVGNSQTDDFTVVDTNTGEVLDRVAAGGFAIRFMPSAGVALVVSDDKVHVVDLTTRVKQPELVIDSKPAFEQVHTSPDARVAVMQGAEEVLVVDATSGKLTAARKPFNKVVDVDIDWGVPASPR